MLKFLNLHIFMLYMNFMSVVVGNTFVNRYVILSPPSYLLNINFIIFSKLMSIKKSWIWYVYFYQS